MPDYRIENRVPYPTPELLVNQSNPFNSLNQGLQQGAALGLQFSQQKRLAEQQQQEMVLRKREQEDKDINAFGSVIKQLRSYPDRYKPGYFDKVVVPIGQRIGLDMTKGYDHSFDGPVVEDVSQLFEMFKKDPKSYPREHLIADLQRIGEVHQRQGEETTAKYFQDMANTQAGMGKSEMSAANGSAEKGQFVGVQNGQAVIFNPVSKSLELQPFPGQGTFLPKAEPGKIGEQTIQNTEALALVDDLESKLKGSSGASGALKAVGAKLTAGAIAPDLRIYEQQRPAIAVKLYRSITKDTRLSDADAAARALPLLPSAYEPVDVQQGKIKAIREAVSNNTSNMVSLLSGVPVPSPTPAGVFTDAEKEKRYQEWKAKQK